MEYIFATFEFSKGQQRVRIHFENPCYQGLERFFNDDALLLQEKIEQVEEYLWYEDQVSFAGNRTVIVFTGEEVTVKDQWDPEVSGYFSPVTISRQAFDDIYKNWEDKLHR